jgi:hypothetical protein
MFTVNQVVRSGHTDKNRNLRGTRAICGQCLPAGAHSSDSWGIASPAYQSTPSARPDAHRHLSLDFRAMRTRIYLRKQGS